MEQLLNMLGIDTKVDTITSKYKPSLEETPEYEYAEIVVKTKRNLYNWAKNLIIKPTDNEGIYNVSINCSSDPTNTPLKDLYNDFKAEEWKRPSYAHESPRMVVNVDRTGVFKLLNWVYSSIN